MVTKLNFIITFALLCDRENGPESTEEDLI
jgi:hypothetical protein